jgi:hypothetical protein
MLELRGNILNVGFEEVLHDLDTDWGGGSLQRVRRDVVLIACDECKRQRRTEGR